VERAAIVTGAASGIGRAIAIRLARDGFAVAVVDIQHQPRDGGRPTDELIRADGGTAAFLQADLAVPEACEQAVSDVITRYDSLDVLVNNAVLAGRHSKPLLETANNDWEAMMAVNVRGPFVLSRAAVREMLRRPARREVRGRIINITSQHGMVGAPGHFAYAVGKGALVQMTRQIAVEHARDGILCNAVAPGKILTGADGDLSQSEAGRDYGWSRTPFSRLGRPEDVAGAVAFLASDDANYVSGVNLLVDGGWMAY
jgi:NAD(P)-dependent dehydrogenase (short-subunit alcohol dehydrogenase family)